MTTRERGRNESEREAEMSVRVSCDLGWAAMATTIWAEAETRVIERVRKRQRVIRISESEARVSFEGWGLNFFNMLQKMPYRGKKKGGTTSFKAWNKATAWTAWTSHGSQNRTVRLRFGRFHAFFAWNGSAP